MLYQFVNAVRSSFCLYFTNSFKSNTIPLGRNGGDLSSMQFLFTLFIQLAIEVLKLKENKVRQHWNLCVVSSQEEESLFIEKIQELRKLQNLLDTYLKVKL